MTVQKTQDMFSLMSRLIKAEWLKTEHPRRLLLFMILPAVVTALIGWLAGHHKDIFLDITAWQEVWQTILFFWSSFAFSFFIVILAAKFNGIEHSNQSWRLMLTLPLRPCHLFFAKLSIEWGLLLFSNIMMVLVYSSAFLIGAHSPIAGQTLDMPLVNAFLLLPFVMLPVLFIQHSLSWFLSNTRFPVILGNICSLMSIAVSGYFQDKGWLFYPWDYGMRFANNALDIKIGEKIIPISQTAFFAFVIALFLIASLGVTAYLKRRDIH
ncbi:MAG: ABC transporter permease [Zymomonas mobilis]